VKHAFRELASHLASSELKESKLLGSFSHTGLLQNHCSTVELGRRLSRLYFRIPDEREHECSRFSAR